MGWSHPKGTYDHGLDFDEVGSEGTSQAKDSELTSDPAAPGGNISLSDSGSSEWAQFDSDQASGMDDIQGLSEMGSTESGSSNSWETSSSFGSNASSSWSRSPAISTERLRTRELLSSSGNARHYHEIIAQHHAKQCDKCEQPVVRWLHCFECSNLDYPASTKAGGVWTSLMKCLRRMERVLS